MDESHGDTWHEDMCHVAPDKWTLGTWEAKCHVLVMHEISGGDEQSMKNTWHRIVMCQGGLGGVLYTQTKIVCGRKERKQKKERENRGEKKKKKKNRKKKKKGRKERKGKDRKKRK